MNKFQLKQLIREVVEEMQGQQVDQMMKALQQNPEVAQELINTLSKKGKLATTEGLGSSTMKKLAMLLLAAGISASAVAKSDVQDADALIAQLSNISNKQELMVYQTYVTPEQAKQIQSLKQQALQMGKKHMLKAKTHEERVNVYKAVNQAMKKAVTGILGDKGEAKFVKSLKNYGHFDLDYEYVSITQLMP